MKLFDALRGAIPLKEVSFVGLFDEHLLVVEQVTSKWKETCHWVEWCTRLPHL